MNLARVFLSVKFQQHRKTFYVLLRHRKQSVLNIVRGVTVAYEKLRALAYVLTGFLCLEI
jgi:hypothetical protein